jgi:hypothetical protein
LPANRRTQLRKSYMNCPPLLQVPPASRGEPRTGSVPPARRGNLKEGVLVYPYFCELWLGDWYKLPQGGRGVGGEGRKYDPLARLQARGSGVAALRVHAITFR